MSTGLECEFVERKPGQWYYLLENYDAPKMAWDWLEYATCYGPFPTEEEARDHLHGNHANPGGSGTLHYAEGREWDEVMEKLFAAATNDDRRRPHYSRLAGWR